MPSLICFIVTVPPSTPFSTLSLHDALPILHMLYGIRAAEQRALQSEGVPVRVLISYGTRSEEHTSELQSRGHLVCRLLLEKKKPPRPSSGSAPASSAEPTRRRRGPPYPHRCRSARRGRGGARSAPGSVLLCTARPPPRSTLFPYTTLFRSHMLYGIRAAEQRALQSEGVPVRVLISYGT